MRLEKASLKAIQYSCKYFHYSKSVPVLPFGFSVYNDNDEWCGTIIYSCGANPNLGKSYGLVFGEIIELTRMALNGKQESTSKALSLSIRLLPKFAPLIRLIVSFADQNQNHFGTIYQATNFYYTGIGKSTPLWKVNGKLIHQRQLGSLGYKIKGCKFEKIKQLDKYKYIYPIDKSLIPLCKSLQKEYPKKQAQLPDKGQDDSIQNQRAFDSTIALQNAIKTE